MARAWSAVLLAAAILGFVAAPAQAWERSSVVLAGHTLLALQGDAAAERVVRARGGVLVGRELRLWRVPAREAETLIPRLHRRGALRYAEPDVALEPTIRLPSDPLTAPELAYHLYRIGADRVEPPAAGFPVTVIDSGVDFTHPELAARPNTAALNTQSIASSTALSEYHGTVVALTAVAPVDGIGGVGVYPTAPLRAFDAGELTDATVVEGLLAAAEAGPSVINLSFGSPFPSKAIQEALLFAFGRGSLVVASAGNEFARGNPVLYPASFAHVLTVAATDRSDAPAAFSSGSFAVDLAAPGQEIPFARREDPNTPRLVSGTSFAAPIVSAAAAAVKAARPELTVAQLFELMRSSARDVGPAGFDDRTGFGVLDLPEAMTREAPPNDPQEPNDSLRQIVAGGLFRQAKPPIRAGFRAALDVTEDPDDYYRLVVPPRRTVTISVASPDDVAAELLRRGGRLRRSDLPGDATERLVYRNATRREVETFLHVAPAERSPVGAPHYRVMLRVTR